MRYQTLKFGRDGGGEEGEGELVLQGLCCGFINSNGIKVVSHQSRTYCIQAVTVVTQFHSPETAAVPSELK